MRLWELGQVTDKFHLSHSFKGHFDSSYATLFYALYWLTYLSQPYNVKAVVMSASQVMKHDQRDDNLWKVIEPVHVRVRIIF